MVHKFNKKYKNIIFAVSVLLTSSIVSAYYLTKPTANTQYTAPSRIPAAIAPPQVQESLLPSFETELKPPAPFETSLKLDCQDFFNENLKDTSASVSSNHVILKLLKCGKAFGKVAKVELINKTNGYNAQLFQLNKAELNSDFIQLDRGVNQLEFQFSLIDGQKKTQTFKINRIQ